MFSCQGKALNCLKIVSLKEPPSTYLSAFNRIEVGSVSLTLFIVDSTQINVTLKKYLIANNTLNYQCNASNFIL